MSDLSWMPTTVVLYRTRYVMHAYKDFWDIDMPAYVVLERVVITRSDEVYEYNNGYGDETSYVYHDENGRTFYHHVYVDGVGWRLLTFDSDSPGLWEHRLSVSRRYVRDGEPVSIAALTEDLVF